MCMKVDKDIRLLSQVAPRCFLGAPSSGVHAPCVKPCQPPVFGAKVRKTANSKSGLKPSNAPGPGTGAG